jgi:hypothetical protein
MTFIAALRHDRIEAPWMLDGPVNGGAFKTYVEKVLVPTLKPGDLVIMDNLSSHKARTFGWRSGQPAQSSSSCPNILPTDRAGLRQAQAPVAKGRSANRRNLRRRSRAAAGRIHRTRMRKLFRKLTIPQPKFIPL